MRSPIARGLFALGRLVEWGHRRIHGPKYAPGDVVVTTKGTTHILRFRDEDKEGVWWQTYGSRTVREDDIIRVVRYGEGE